MVLVRVNRGIDPPTGSFHFFDWLFLVIRLNQIANQQKTATFTQKSSPETGPGPTFPKEGFYVEDPEGKMVGFGHGLLEHIDSDSHHAPAGALTRKRRLIYAVQTVTHPDRTEKNHRSIPGRTAYAKAFDDFGILAITEPESDVIAKVFTYFPRRGARKR